MVIDTAGVDKKDIKLKAPILYVQGKKYAEFTNSSLVKYFTIDSSTLTVDNTIHLMIAAPLPRKLLLPYCPQQSSPNPSHFDYSSPSVINLPLLSPLSCL